MPDPVQRNQPWAVAVAFAAGDASKVIKATPGVGLQLVVTKCLVYVTTSAAQSFGIQDDNGTPVVVAALPPSYAGALPGVDLTVGIALTANKNLVYKPAAAGPAGLVVAEGYIINPG